MDIMKKKELNQQEIYGVLKNKALDNLFLLKDNSFSIYRNVSALALPDDQALRKKIIDFLNDKSKHIFILGCSDSLVDPKNLFNLKELNEIGIQTEKKHIVIMGHYNCGGMKVLEAQDKNNDKILSWVNKANIETKKDNSVKEITEDVIKVSSSNLQKNEAVKDALKSDKLEIHSLFVNKGKLTEFNPEINKFMDIKKINKDLSPLILQLGEFYNKYCRGSNTEYNQQIDSGQSAKIMVIDMHLAINPTQLLDSKPNEIFAFRDYDITSQNNGRDAFLQHGLKNLKATNLVVIGDNQEKVKQAIQNLYENEIVKKQGFARNDFQINGWYIDNNKKLFYECDQKGNFTELKVPSNDNNKSYEVLKGIISKEKLVGWDKVDKSPYLQK